jgi:hypothetical protein
MSPLRVWMSTTSRQQAPAPWIAPDAGQRGRNRAWKECGNLPNGAVGVIPGWRLRQASPERPRKARLRRQTVDRPASQQGLSLLHGWQALGDFCACGAGNPKKKLPW